MRTLVVVEKIVSVEVLLLRGILLQQGREALVFLPEAEDVLVHSV